MNYREHFGATLMELLWYSYWFAKIPLKVMVGHLLILYRAGFYPDLDQYLYDRRIFPIVRQLGLLAGAYCLCLGQVNLWYSAFPLSLLILTEGFKIVKICSYTPISHRNSFLHHKTYVTMVLGIFWFLCSYKKKPLFWFAPSLVFYMGLTNHYLVDCWGFLKGYSFSLKDMIVSTGYFCFGLFCSPYILRAYGV